MVEALRKAVGIVAKMGEGSDMGDMAKVLRGSWIAASQGQSRWRDALTLCHYCRPSTHRMEEDRKTFRNE